MVKVAPSRGPQWVKQISTDFRSSPDRPRSVLDYQAMPTVSRYTRTRAAMPATIRL